MSILKYKDKTTGEWLPVSGNSSGGASSWNDLIDKPFDSEIKESVWMEETVCEDVGESELEIPLPEGKTIKDGATYIVTWNGVQYSCVAEIITVEDITACYFGEPGFVTGELTGSVPFACVQVDQQGAFISLDGSHSVTVSVIEIAEEVTPIPKKYVAPYLADCLPYYVDIQYDGENYSTAETVAHFKEVFESGRAIFARMFQVDDTFGQRAWKFIPLSIWSPDHGNGIALFETSTVDLTLVNDGSGNFVVNVSHKAPSQRVNSLKGDF